MEAFVVACSLLILASVAFFLILGVVEKLLVSRRLGVCARCGKLVEYPRWRTPPWCPACEEEVWRTGLDEPLSAGPRTS